jgi:imidazolonepropionase
VKSLAVLHARQLVTLAGPNRPRVGPEMQDLAIIPDGGMLIVQIPTPGLMFRGYQV